MWNNHTGELNVRAFVESRNWHWCTVKLADKLMETQEKAEVKILNTPLA